MEFQQTLLGISQGTVKNGKQTGENKALTGWTLRKFTISIQSRRSFFLETKPKRTEIKLWKNTNEGYYPSTGKMERRGSEINWRYTEAFNVASMGNKWKVCTDNKIPYQCKTVAAVSIRWRVQKSWLVLASHPEILQLHLWLGRLSSLQSLIHWGLSFSLERHVGVTHIPHILKYSMLTHRGNCQCHDWKLW